MMMYHTTVVDGYPFDGVTNIVLLMVINLKLAEYVHNRMCHSL